MFMNRLEDRTGRRLMSSPMQFVDGASALVTSLLRITAKYHPHRPWISLPAYRYLRVAARSDWKVFEYGGGMSTLWYHRHCAEVHTVEENEAWARFLMRRSSAGRVNHRVGAAYVEAVLDFKRGYFDLIVVDGMHRLDCFRAAIKASGPNTVILIDDTDTGATDADMAAINLILRTYAPSRVLRFPGFGDCYFFPKETTIVIPDSGSGD